MNKDIFKALGMFTQIAATLATPIFLCIVAAYFLTEKCGIGNWLIIVGAVMGTASGFLNLYKLFHSIIKRDD